MLLVKFQSFKSITKLCHINLKILNICIKLDAETNIWMQSRFDRFDFSATLLQSSVQFSAVQCSAA